MMKYVVNGRCIEPTPEEITAMQAEAERAEAEYWASIPYDEAVNSKIRERYSQSQEFAILRQKEEKPDEYRIYYDFGEACKTFVKAQKGGALIT